MIACPSLAPIDTPAGRVCSNCGRPVARYRDRDEHRRGRVAGVSPKREARPSPEVMLAAARLRDIDLDGDTCECGQPADPALHSPLPKPGPLNPWKASRNLPDMIGWHGEPLKRPGAHA